MSANPVMDRESPDVLEYGTWDHAGMVLRWVASSPDEQERLAVLLACPTCHARIDQLCRTRSGRPRAAHRTRLVTKRCGCGGSLGFNRKLCDACRADARRDNGRRGMQGTRTRRRVEQMMSQDRCWFPLDTYRSLCGLPVDDCTEHADARAEVTA